MADSKNTPSELALSAAKWCFLSAIAAAVATVYTSGVLVKCVSLGASSAGVQLKNWGYESTGPLGVEMSPAVMSQVEHRFKAPQRIDALREQQRVICVDIPSKSVTSVHCDVNELVSFEWIRFQVLRMETSRLDVLVNARSGAIERNNRVSEGSMIKLAAVEILLVLSVVLFLFWRELSAIPNPP